MSNGAGAGKRFARHATLVRWWFWVAAVLLFAYLALATQVFLTRWPLRYWLVCCLLAALLLLWVARRSRHLGRLAGMALAATVGLAAFLFVDTTYNIVLRRWATPLPFAFESTQLSGVLELHRALPRYRGPQIPGVAAGRNKPHAVIGGEVFGELAPPQLVENARFRRRVVEPRRVIYQLDGFGFRNPPGRWEQATAVALGDSFVFGAGTAAEEIWVERLNARGGDQPTFYNMGELGTWPPGQWQRFRVQLARKRDSRLRTVVWMIFGGNDMHPPSALEFAGDRARVLEGTPLVGPLRMVEAARDDSIVARTLTGRLRPLRYDDAFYFEGNLLPAPMYRGMFKDSGWKLFYPPYLQLARRAEFHADEVIPLLRIRAVWNQLKSMQEARGWTVLIVYVPSAAQALGELFRLEVTSDHFLDWVSTACAEVGLPLLDLTAALGRATEGGLPYWRDDTHFNGWGHEVAAREIAAALQSLRNHGLESDATADVGSGATRDWEE